MDNVRTDGRLLLIDLKRNKNRGHRLISPGSRQGKVVGLSEHSNEPLCSVTYREFPDLQNTNKLRKKTPMDLVKDSNSCVTTHRHLIFNMVTDISYMNVV
jgi:hypothetical protein